MNKLLILSLLFSFSASANTCKRLIDCVSETSKLTGIKYLYPENMFKDSDEMNVEMILNKENAEQVLSEALSMFEYMKVPTKLDQVWRIFPGMDIRYHADLPTIKANKKDVPQIPNNRDPIHFVYQAQSGTEVGDIARNLRPFLTRYGRIIDLRGGMLIIIDRASVISQVLPIIKAADVPLSKAEKAASDKRRQRDHEMELIQMKNFPANGPQPLPGKK
ncbi:MAG: hypothetical protein H0V66_05280 [Bdellovibrionales bacterium]|nr:hypothetical protein [Bdellovibrionales bacterium]